MSDKKHYVLVSLTLGIIAASSALIISGTNLLTKDKIAQNEKDRVLAGIVEIYGKNAVISAEKDIKEAGLTGNYQYVNYVYTIKDNNETQLGYAFRTTGSNSYGKISLLVGFDESTKAFKKMSVVVNEQSYASTLVDGYINPVNAGTAQYDDDATIHCGATYGAKKVREMIDEAKLAAEELWSLV